MTAINTGDKVKLLGGDIDGRKHAGEIGVVKGFARFSKYHSREVMVGAPDNSWSAWFWASDVEAV